MFKQKDERKTNWMHHRSRHWHTIDFVITSCREKVDIHSTRAISGANCWTYHQMLRSKVAFRIRHKHNRQGTSKTAKLNTAKLSTISRRECFEQDMCSRVIDGEGTLNTSRVMGSCSAAGRIQHSQDIYWQATPKTPGLVRPQRPGATDSYAQKKPSPPESVTNQKHYIHHCSVQRCVQTATKTHPCTEVRLVGKKESGAAESC